MEHVPTGACGARITAAVDDVAGGADGPAGGGGSTTSYQGQRCSSTSLQT